MELLNINRLFNQLKQDEKSDIQILKLIDGQMSLFIAELKAGKILPSHYHNEGSEIYQILVGEGTVELGELVGNTVTWNKSFMVTAGDVFEVKPQVIHRLSNNSSESLRLIFFAPPSHLVNDRIFL